MILEGYAIQRNFFSRLQRLKDGAHLLYLWNGFTCQVDCLRVKQFVAVLRIDGKLVAVAFLGVQQKCSVTIRPTVVNALASARIYE